MKTQVGNTVRQPFSKNNLKIFYISIYIIIIILLIFLRNELVT